MPEVYTNRAPEKFNYHADDLSSSRGTRNGRRNSASRPQLEWKRSDNYSSRSDDSKQTPVRNLLKPPPTPIYSQVKPSQARPEFYHIRADDNHTDRSSPISRSVEQRRSPVPSRSVEQRRSPVLSRSVEQRRSPVPSHGQRPEMYHLRTSAENPPEHRRQSPFENTVRHQPKPNNVTTNHRTIPTHSESPHPGKVTTYMIATSNENIPPAHIERAPSPPIRPSKKKSAVAFHTVDDHKPHDVSNKKHQFPTALHDVPTNIRHMPSTHSKATESIQRSMNKYRFGGS